MFLLLRDIFLLKYYNRYGFEVNNNLKWKFKQNILIMNFYNVSYFIKYIDLKW